MQTDIIVYGADLADYFAREFHFVPRRPTPASANASELPFWGQFVD